MKRKIKHDEQKQVPTLTTTPQKIMASPLFKKGVDDMRAGKPFPDDYDTWSHTDKMWGYERGRAWATVAPRRLKPVFNLEALNWFMEANIV